jgi:hypothetical protein
MAAEKTWTPFGTAKQEENPFHFDVARESMKNAIRLAWMATSGWADSPIQPATVARMEGRVRQMLDELLREVREDADRQRKHDAR